MNQLKRESQLRSYLLIKIIVLLFALVSLVCMWLLIVVYLLKAYALIEPTTFKEWVLLLQSVNPVSIILIGFLCSVVTQIAQHLSLKKYLILLLYLTPISIAILLGNTLLDSNTHNVFFIKESAWYYSTRTQLLKQKF